MQSSDLNQIEHLWRIITDLANLLDIIVTTIIKTPI